MMVEEEARVGAETAFSSYVHPLNTVEFFQYLGRILTMTYYDWPAVIGNIQKARRIWDCMLSILGREGEDARTPGRFYLAISQAVLLFGADIWVATPHIRRVL